MSGCPRHNNTHPIHTTQENDEPVFAEMAGLRDLASRKLLDPVRRGCRPRTIKRGSRGRFPDNNSRLPPSS